MEEHTQARTDRHPEMPAVPDAELPIHVLINIEAISTEGAADTVDQEYRNNVRKSIGYLHHQLTCKNETCYYKKKDLVAKTCNC
jgi:hypothetical protein